jgi:hypothetical protein
MQLLDIRPSSQKSKKFMAIFRSSDSSNGKLKYTARHFGQRGAQDFILWSKINPSFARQRRESYLKRHSRERKLWLDPSTPAALSRWILWEKPSLNSAVKEFRQRFGV